MTKLSPKIEIINHFDNLINRVDIDIESSLEKFNDQQLLNELLKSSKYDRSLRNSYVDLAIIYFAKFYPPKPKQNLNP
jgi:CRISPR/Cas system Type II protein with McrA/HNH and RuvC-like nuclease domain